MSSELIGQQQGLVKLTFAQAGGVQGNRDNHIDGDVSWQRADHQAPEWRGQRVCTSIFEGADGVFQRRHIGEERPSPLKGWWPLLTVVTLVVGRVAGSCVRDEGLIADGAGWLLERADFLPAGCAEEGDRVDGEGLFTGQTFHWQDKPDRLTAPADEPLLCEVMPHRGIAPSTVVAL